MSEELTPVQFFPLKFQVKYKCSWKQCTENFNTHEDLYKHLTDKHVGRKVLNTLCLKCGWENCEQQFTKRDHITSHLKIHVAHKPFECKDCSKSFKRAHDLKKHWNRVHTKPAFNPYNKSKFEFNDCLQTSPDSSESCPELSHQHHSYYEESPHSENNHATFRDCQLDSTRRRVRFLEENQFTTSDFKF